MNSPIRHRPFSAIAAVLALAIGTTLPAAAQTTIGASGGSFVQSWGEDAGTPNTQTYGQTITVPTDYVLTSFSFSLGRRPPTSPICRTRAFRSWRTSTPGMRDSRWRRARRSTRAERLRTTPHQPHRSPSTCSRPAACHWSRGTPTRSSSARRGLPATATSSGRPRPAMSTAAATSSFSTRTGYGRVDDGHVGFRGRLGPPLRGQFAERMRQCQSLDLALMLTGLIALVAFGMRRRPGDRGAEHALSLARWPDVPRRSWRIGGEDSSGPVG